MTAIVRLGIVDAVNHFITGVTSDTDASDDSQEVHGCSNQHVLDQQDQSFNNIHWE